MYLYTVSSILSPHSNSLYHLSGQKNNTKNQLHIIHYEPQYSAWHQIVLVTAFGCLGSFSIKKNKNNCQANISGITSEIRLISVLVWSSLKIKAVNEMISYL